MDGIKEIKRIRNDLEAMIWQLQNIQTYNEMIDDDKVEEAIGHMVDAIESIDSSIRSKMW